MTLKKNFLHPDTKSLEISRFRFVAGIIIGLLYSFVFYSFVIVVREGFTLLSVSEYYDIWELSGSEENFYNLFFAFISVILGQSLCFTFWIDRPKKVFRKTNLRRTTIVNDQRVLNWYFLWWFSKLAVCFGIFFGPTLHVGYYAFSFYPDYNYLFILIIIVLYFQTWKTIRQVFKGRSIKWLLVSMIVLTATSYGLSKINLIDFNKLKNGILQKNIFYNYNLELPESDLYQRNEKRSLVEDIFIVTPKGSPNSLKPVIVIDNNEISLSDLPDKIKEIQSSRDKDDAKYIIFNMHIHRDIKMSFINKVRNQLYDIGFRKVSYAVTPCNPEFDFRYYKDIGLQLSLPRFHSDSSDFKEIVNRFCENGDVIEIKPLESGFCLFNETLIEAKDLKKEYKNRMIENPNNIVKFYHNKNLDFSAYIKVLSDLLTVVHELRDVYSISEYSRKYNMLRTYEERKMIRKKYPLLIFEMKD